MKTHIKSSDSILGDNNTPGDLTSRSALSKNTLLTHRDLPENMPVKKFSQTMHFGYLKSIDSADDDIPKN